MPVSSTGSRLPPHLALGHQQAGCEHCTRLHCRYGRPCSAAHRGQRWQAGGGGASSQCSTWSGGGSPVRARHGSDAHSLGLCDLMCCGESGLHAGGAPGPALASGSSQHWLQQASTVDWGRPRTHAALTRSAMRWWRREHSPQAPQRAPGQSRGLQNHRTHLQAPRWGPALFNSGVRRHPHAVSGEPAAARWSGGGEGLRSRPLLAWPHDPGDGTPHNAFPLAAHLIGAPQASKGLARLRPSLSQTSRHISLAQTEGWEAGVDCCSASRPGSVLEKEWGHWVALGVSY